MGSETAAKKVHLKTMLNNLNKGSMSIIEYFSKLKSVTDKLAIVGSPVSSLDFITHLISGFSQAYYLMVVYIGANVLKMSINEAYSMLSIHEACLKSNQSNAFKEAKMNFAANLAQTENNQKNANNNVAWNSNNQGNWNGNNGGRNGDNNWNGNFTNNIGGFNSEKRQNSGRGQWNNNWNGNRGRGNFASAGGKFSGNGGFSGGYGRGIICQICFKHNHSAINCNDNFNVNFTTLT